MLASCCGTKLSKRTVRYVCRIEVTIDYLVGVSKPYIHAVKEHGLEVETRAQAVDVPLTEPQQAAPRDVQPRRASLHQRSIHAMHRHIVMQ